jgi:hypothetical protein
MSEPTPPRKLSRACSFAPPGVWARLVLENGVAPRYWGRLAGVLVPSLLASPFRLAERLRYSRQVARTPIAPPPLFVLGFARSGTTHLHNLLAQDPQHAAVSALQAAAPTFSLVGRGRLERLLARVPRTAGPLDDPQLSFDLPQEEEVAVANTTHLSFLHHLSFPRRSRDYLDKYVFMEGLTAAERAEWERVYLEVARKALLAAGGGRLVQKTPHNIGRVPHLLRLFPDAKFIHIVRNPYTVHQSLLHLYRTVLPSHHLQNFAWEEIEAFVLHYYASVMRRYVEDRSAIPAGHVAEVRFEELERAPMEELRRLYHQLDLPGWESARTPIAAYLESLAGYRKNHYPVDRRSIDAVERHWRFATERWGYAAPEAV